MVEDVIVKVAHVLGVKVVQGSTVQSALFEDVFHTLTVCENLVTGKNVLPYGHIEGMDQAECFYWFLHAGSGIKREVNFGQHCLLFLH